MTSWVGPLLVATGVLHAGVGAVIMSPVLVALGPVTHYAAVAGNADVLAVIGWSLLAIGVVGVVAMPVSGFWILVALSLAMFAGR